jgi:putative solute:sodium symporter small subunit
MASPNARGHWGATSKLMWTALVIWAVFSLAIHVFVSSLNATVVFGFPLGFWFAAQGSPIVLVVLLVWFAWMQYRIDRKYGCAEED